ncbi:MAG TPA: hypothetical protein VGX25_07150, partial [Actinophytocola sp.]
MTDAGMPVVSADIADLWRSMGDGLEQAGILLQQAVSGSEAGWTGQAADAMRVRLSQNAEWIMNTGQGFAMVGSAFGELSEAVGEAKVRMPDPVPYNPGQMMEEAKAQGLLGIIALPVRMYTQWQKHQDAHNEAVAVVAARDARLAAAAASLEAFAPPPTLDGDGGGPRDGDRSGDPGGRDRGDRGIGGGPGGPGGSVSGGSGSGSGDGSGSLGSGPTGRGPQLTDPERDTAGPPGGRPVLPVGPSPAPSPSAEGPGLGTGVRFLPGAGPIGGLGSGGGSSGGG